MGMSKATDAGTLPHESEMDRDDALDAFLTVANVCEPDHPYGSGIDDVYPLKPMNVDYGVCRTYYARCGPMAGGGLKWASYSTRMTYINRISRARHLTLLVHEVSHIPDTADYEHGGHPPSFWREMAFNALLVRDSIREGGAITEAFGDVSEEDFLREIVDDPNSSVADRRYMSVDETKQLLADLVGRPDLGPE